jgi:Predicted membrane protein
MNKEQYLRKLRSLIRELPQSERKTVVDFYREMIDDKMENGQTEQEAVAELGDVFVLAQKILAENPKRRHYSANRIAGIVLATFFSVLIVAGIAFHTLQIGNSANAPAGYSANTNAGRGKVEVKTASAPVSQTKSIYIDVRNRAVNLARGEGDSIQVSYQTDNFNEFTFTNTGGVMKLVEQNRDNFDFFRFFDFRNDFGPVTVSVPERYEGEVYLHSGNGGITVDDLSHVSKLTCDTSNARITIDNVHVETVNATTSNGRIQLEKLTASSVDADTSNGEIMLQNLTSPDVTLTTSNGGIRGNLLGREEDYTIHTDTSNGSCTPSGRQGGSKRLTADTSNASINIEFTE